MSKQATPSAKPEPNAGDNKSPDASAAQMAAGAAGAVAATVGSIIVQAISDDNFVTWFGHGANELATTILTGHPAPVYGHFNSPEAAEQQTEVAADGGDQAVAVENATKVGIVDGLLNQLKAGLEGGPQAEMTTSHGPAAENGIVDDLMNELQESANHSEPDQEMSK